MDLYHIVLTAQFVLTLALLLMQLGRKVGTSDTTVSDMTRQLNDLREDLDALRVEAAERGRVWHDRLNSVNVWQRDLYLQLSRDFASKDDVREARELIAALTARIDAHINGRRSNG